MNQPKTPSLAEIHVDRNRVTRGDWQTYGPHREQISQILLQAGQGRDHPSLCILGAGNANDLDLLQLAQAFGRITLVDLDNEALNHGIERLPPVLRHRTEVIGGADLSGVLPVLERLSAGEDDVNLDAMIAASRRPQPDPRLSTYDVVASTCLMTQLIDSASFALRRRLAREDADSATLSQRGVSHHPHHRRLAEVALAIRDGHLKLLCDLLRPQGTVALVTDFVSSDSLPELQSVPPGQLGKLVSAAINQGNFFTGANPMVLAHWFAREFGEGIFDVVLHPPWRWRMGDRFYAAAAITARRTA